MEWISGCFEQEQQECNSFLIAGCTDTNQGDDPIILPVHWAAPTTRAVPHLTSCPLISDAIARHAYFWKAPWFLFQISTPRAMVLGLGDWSGSPHFQYCAPTFFDDVTNWGQHRRPLFPGGCLGKAVVNPITLMAWGTHWSKVLNYLRQIQFQIVLLSEDMSDHVYQFLFQDMSLLSSLLHGSCLRNLGHHCPKHFPQNLVLRDALWIKTVLWENTAYTMNITMLNASIEEKPTCTSSISPSFVHQEAFSFFGNTYKHPGMKEHFFEKCSQVCFNLDQRRKCNIIYEKNDNLQISTDKNIVTLKFTCE